MLSIQTTTATKPVARDLELEQAIWDLQDRYTPDEIAAAAIAIAIETAADNAENDAYALLTAGQN